MTSLALYRRQCLIACKHPAVTGSIVAFQMHDEFNEPHRHESQRDKYANDVDPTYLPT